MSAWHIYGFPSLVVFCRDRDFVEYAYDFFPLKEGGNLTQRVPRKRARVRIMRRLGKTALQQSWWVGVSSVRELHSRQCGGSNALESIINLVQYARRTTVMSLSCRAFGTMCMTRGPDHNRCRVDFLLQESILPTF